MHRERLNRQAETVAAVEPSDPAELPSTQPAESAEVPAPVLRSYREWTLQETAADALGRIGAAAVPELTGALRAADPEVRRQATRVLGRIGPEALLAVPELRRLLSDQDPAVRQAAARALGQIGPAAASAVPELIRLLEEPPQDDSDSPGVAPAEEAPDADLLRPRSSRSS